MSAGEGLQRWDTDTIVDAVMGVHAEMTDFRDPGLLQSVELEGARERIGAMLDRMRRTQVDLAALPSLVEDAFGGGVPEEGLQYMRAGSILTALIIGRCEEIATEEARAKIAQRAGTKPQ